MTIKNLLLICTLSFVPALGFSMSCPMKMGQVDMAISELDSNQYSTIIKAASMLRDEGEKAHKNGKHQLSEDILAAALRLLAV